MVRRCDNTSIDCHNEGTWEPCINFYGEGRVGQHTPGQFYMVGIVLCSECIKQVSLKELVPDDGWEIIDRILDHNDLAKPDRSTAWLTWATPHSLQGANDVH